MNVGTEAHLKRLRSEYLEDSLLSFDGSDGASTYKFIEADFGNGKTQFLRCMQEDSWELDYVTAFVELSQDECPLDRSDLVYSAIARSIQARPLKPGDLDRGRGIDVALDQLLDRMFPDVLSGSPDDSVKHTALTWIKSSFASTPADSLAYRTVATQYLLSKITGDEEKSRLAAEYLRGESVQLTNRRALGVEERLDRTNGFRFLRSLCQLVQRAGLATGTVLLFDEARRTLSLMSSRSQKIACENLLSVINRCNADELPGTLFLYAVMPEFFTGFATNYPALQGRCGPASRINVDTLQGTKEIDLLLQIGKRINSIAREAYDDAPDEGPTLDANLRLTADRVYRKAHGAGTRRLFVRTWVSALRDMRENGTREFVVEDVAKLMTGAIDELSAAEESQVLGEGE